MKITKKKSRTGPGKKKSIDKRFPIVAIGASAGGLEAIMELLNYLPSTTGMAYIFLQHQDVHHKSKLTEILSQETKMPVEDAKPSTVMKPDTLYILPASKELWVLDTTGKFAKAKDKSESYMPIDKFLVSLAENQKDGCIAVLLSGSAHDGTLGLRAVKTAGGITFAQDDTALFKSMPKSAIAEGTVDMVLAPKEIAEELSRISKNKNVIQAAMTDSSEADLNDEDLKNILQLLKKSTGVDFKHYKMNTIRRRIVRRMLLYQLETLGDYAKYLKQHTNEINVLYQDLLINVTAFFRDADSLEYLKKAILPKIIKNKSHQEPIRVWIPACSTGEEAYSLAIILMELLNDKATNIPVQIFATDLSELAIAKARLGLYSKNDLIGVSPKRLQRFFTKIDGSYRIVKSIRDLCVFAPHNVFKDPPFSRIDLISCCNLLIYLDLVLQKKIIATFHYALNKNGYLVLGRSETIETSGQLFSQLEKKFKVYARKNDGTDRAKIEMSYRLPDAEQTETLRAFGIANKKPSVQDNNLEKSVDSVLLEKNIPACVVVNHDLEILQFRGSTGLFLEPSPGKASLNLLKMARAGLSFELRNLVHKATKSGHAESKSNVEVRQNGAPLLASIEVVPMAGDGEERLFLIVFKHQPATSSSEVTSPLSKDNLVKHLQKELETLKDDMRSILEEQEASVEELQSANEEVVSSNEELQSINEELETSKEEVESTNEELMTINNELQVRNEQLAESYEYGQAVFDTIREAVLVLDQDLRIRTANKAFYTTFKMKEEDTEGMLIFELGNRQWDIQELRKLLYEIIPNHPTYNAFEMQHDFPHIGEKVMLVNARRITQKVHRKQLILLAIEDITEHRNAQKIMAERETWFRNMADNAPVMIWVAGLDKKRNFFNKTWLEFTGQRPETDRSESWKEAVHQDDLQGYLDTYNVSFLERNTFQAEYRLRRYDGQYRWMMDLAKPTYSANGGFIGYIGSCTELHDKKLLHDELEKRVAKRTRELEDMNKELQRSNSELQQFAYVASHDLQEPLRKIMTFYDRLDGIRTSLPEPAQTYLDKIEQSSRRMTRLIDDLLDYSRISKSDGKFVKTDLNKIVKDVLVDFEVVIGQKKAQLSIKELPVLPAVPLQMEQLFHNLLSNSFKFAKSDTPPVISITASNLKTEEVEKRASLSPAVPYVDIVVRDNGIGFPEEFSEQIFIIFQRLNEQKHYPGTGIGLALCNRIVVNHGGEIYATSVENQGAEFHVILPLRRNHKE